jgi:hypothetical protein
MDRSNGPEGIRVIRAHISEPFEGLSSLNVIIADHLEEGRVMVMHLDENGRVRWDECDRHAEPTPTLTLPMDTGRALLDALTRHYQGAEDTRQLRKDYERERTRVDEQAKVLADIARTLASKVLQQ